MGYVMNAIITVVVLIIGWFLRGYFPSYFKQKGKNLATREDIEEITTIQQRVITDFQKILQAQNAELNEKLEELRHQQSKLLKDYELYTTKKHEYYPELYKQIALSRAQVEDLRPKVKIEPTFENANLADIKMFMEYKKFTKFDQEQIEYKWKKGDKSEAIKDLKHRLNLISYREAEQSHVEAHNFYYLNILFFSEEVSSTAKDLLKCIGELCANYSPELVGYKEKENGELKNKIKNLDKKLVEQLKAELLIKED